jgi:hypothetical protein
VSDWLNAILFRDRHGRRLRRRRVLAIVGVIVLAIGTTGGGESEAALSCSSGPGELGVACAGHF